MLYSSVPIRYQFGVRPKEEQKLWRFAHMIRTENLCLNTMSTMPPHTWRKTNINHGSQLNQLDQLQLIPDYSLALRIVVEAFHRTEQKN